MSKKIIISGGGTGGHIYPAIAIANALKELEPDITSYLWGRKVKWRWKKFLKRVM